MVGRCYMSHIAGTHGWLTLNTRRKPAFYRFAKDRHGAYYRRRIRLSDEAQRELQVMNVIGFPHRPPIHDPSHGDAVLSLAYLQNVLRPPAGGSRPTGGSIGRHVANVAFANPAAWLNAARQFWLRTRRPRLPFVLPYNARAQDAFAFQAEHAPNPESRVRLSRQRDEFGVPRIEPQVRFSEIDFRTVTTFYRELDRALRADQLGCLEYDPVELDEHLKRITTHFDSIAHQLGTTRMSSNPKLGVVDPDCRAHSVANLYLAGGSVFPTSGHANPTLTIVALTLRLVDHLAGRFAPMRLDQAGGSAPAASGLA